MKTTRKILSVALAFILVFSTFGMVMASANSASEASLSVNISVPAPRAGNSPCSRGSLSVSDNTIYITEVTWAYRAPGEGAYHIMSGSDTFRSGYSYRIYIDYEPNSNAGVPIGYNPSITVNGSYASTSSNSFSKVYYDFGTIGGSSGGVGGGSSGGSDSGFSFFDILLLPLEILIFPFAFIAGMIAGLFGL